MLDARRKGQLRELEEVKRDLDIVMAAFLSEEADGKDKVALFQVGVGTGMGMWVWVGWHGTGFSLWCGGLAGRGGGADGKDKVVLSQVGSEMLEGGHQRTRQHFAAAVAAVERRHLFGGPLCAR